MLAKDLYKNLLKRCNYDIDYENISAGIDKFKEELERIERENDPHNTRERHILVIGGAGYIGSILTRKLLDKGYKVRVLDGLLYNNGFTMADLLENPSFSFIKGDFCDSATLVKSLENITDVIHLAALVGDPICKKYPELARMINEEGTKRLIDSLCNCKINKFIFTSTCSNYGLRSSDEPATENSELNPMSLYAETKVNVEKYIIEKHVEFDYCPTILRLSTAFGTSRRMRFDLTVSEFTYQLISKKYLLVYDENTWRPYCHVNDISRAIIRVLETPERKVRGEIFNVGADENNFTKKMIVDLIIKNSTEKNLKIEYKHGGFDPRNYRVSFAKISSKLDFKFLYNVENSVSSLINALGNGLYFDVESRKETYGNYTISQT